MIKKMVYYGLGMLILAAALFFGSGYLLSNGLGKSITVSNFTIGADNFTTYPITYANTTELAVYVISNKPLNSYLMENSSYSKWDSHMLAFKNASGLSYAEQINVSSNDIFKNASLAVIPIIVNNTNASMSKFYVVLDNTFGSKSFNTSVNATLTYFPIHSSNIVVYELIDVLAFVILIAGIIILIWGLAKSNEPKISASEVSSTAPKSEKDKEYVNQLYKGVKKSKKKKKTNKDNDKNS